MRRGLAIGGFRGTLYSAGMDYMRQGKVAADAGKTEEARRLYWNARDCLTRSKEPRAHEQREACARILNAIGEPAGPTIAAAEDVARRNAEVTPKEFGEAAHNMAEAFTKNGTNNDRR